MSELPLKLEDNQIHMNRNRKLIVKIRWAWASKILGPKSLKLIGRLRRTGRFS